MARQKAGGGGGGARAPCAPMLDPPMLYVHSIYDCICNYRRSGKFHVKKLSYDKFSCKKIFIGTTPYRISVNSAC